MAEELSRAPAGGRDVQRGGGAAQAEASVRDARKASEPVCTSEAAATSTGAAEEPRRYQFFNHAACEFYPCHDMPAEELNCLFCFCPLYALGPACGGNYRYVGERGDIKDCSACTLPHRRENYDYLMGRYAEIQRLAAPGDGSGQHPSA